MARLFLRNGRPTIPPSSLLSSASNSPVRFSLVFFVCFVRLFDMASPSHAMQLCSRRTHARACSPPSVIPGRARGRHVKVFDCIERVDDSLTLLGSIYLLLTCFIPFATKSVLTWGFVFFIFFFFFFCLSFAVAAPHTSLKTHTHTYTDTSHLTHTHTTCNTCNTNTHGNATRNRHRLELIDCARAFHA